MSINSSHYEFSNPIGLFVKTVFITIIFLLFIAGLVYGQHENPYSKQLTVTLDVLPKDAKPLELILVEKGTFIMGCPVDERGRVGREWQPHEVEITKSFYLGKYEITQAQWTAMMGVNPAADMGTGDNYPVYNVSWDDTQEFIQKLNQLNQGVFRLPTEAEWEMACRAGTRTRYSFGDALDSGDVKEFSEEYHRYMWWGGTNGQHGYPEGTKEVGLKLPNSWGFYDMHGNVWEWCQDYFHIPKNPNSKRIDPVITQESEHRVMKGGAWMSYALHLRSSDRSLTKPHEHGNYLGLRIVREL